MKILGKLPPSAAPLAVAITFVLSSGNLRAFGPGGAGGNAGGGNGAATGGGAVASGGSHGGAGVAGGGHSSFSAPAVSGARPGVSFSNNGSRAFGGVATHGSFARSGGLNGYPQGTRSVFPAAGTPQAVGQLPARSANAWSGTAVNTTASRASTNGLYTSNGFTGSRFAGRAPTNGYNRGFGGNGYRNGFNNGRYRSPYKYYNYPYTYGPYYAPYLGYYGGYSGAYPYYADGTYSDISNGAIGYDNGAATVTPEYADQGQDANAGDQPAPATQPAPQVDSQTQNGNNAAQGTIPNNGPDSLVEAVQQELIRRGYFGGKVDAMYGPDTRDALRKFQQDHHLADTGLINEATLHALQLD